MKKLLIAALLFAGLTQAVAAQTVEERLLAGLQTQGFTVLEKGYTFLGRLRIVAENGQIRREIVVNPGTGEILRDYAVYLSDMPMSLPEVPVATRDTKTGRSVAVAETGTAGVAASALPPGTSTLGSASIQVDTTKAATAFPLDDTILPMISGHP